jgi:hypothetical protein
MGGDTAVAVVPNCNAEGAMKYTAEKPSRPGWYFYLEHGWAGCACVFLDWSGFIEMEEPGCRQLEVMWPENEDDLPIGVDEASGMWAGPISEPERE